MILCQSGLLLRPAPHPRLSNGDFALAGRYHFDLDVPTTVAKQPCQCRVTDAEHHNNTMDCKLTAGVATLRHDVWASTSCSAIRWVGYVTSTEPSYSKLLARGQHGCVAALRRVDIRICAVRRTGPFLRTGARGAE